MRRTMAPLFQRLTQGVYVVGVAHGGVRNAFTAAWVMQVSFDPLLTLSINPHHSSYRLLKEGRAFSVNVLKEGRAFSVNVLKKGQLDLAEHYGQPARADKLAGTEWTTDRTGLPLLREALAWFECEFLNEHPAGDHMLVLGKVIGGKLLDSEAEPISPAPDPYMHSIGARLAQPLRVSASVGAETLASPSGL